VIALAIGLKRIEYQQLRYQFPTDPKAMALNKYAIVFMKKSADSAE
jgi:hypothetical protein